MGTGLHADEVMGVHDGPCIVVNLNERLDYFGSMVNVAARLTEYAQDGEIVLPETVYTDDRVQAWLQENKVNIENCPSRFRGPRQIGARMES